MKQKPAVLGAYGDLKFTLPVRMTVGLWCTDGCIKSGKRWNSAEEDLTSKMATRQACSMISLSVHDHMLLVLV